MVAHSHSTRQLAYELWSSGEKKSKIARTLGVDYDTLLGWVKRFKSEGSAGVSLRYDRCGRKVRGDEDEVKARSLALRQAHGEWGAGYIRLNLQREFPEASIPQARQIQRWLRAAGAMKVKTVLPPVKTDWAARPLDCVQVDAKEQLTTKDGKGCCYLNFTDERSGANLDAFVFPPQPNQSSAGDPDI